MKNKIIEDLNEDGEILNAVGTKLLVDNAVEKMQNLINTATSDAITINDVSNYLNSNKYIKEDVLGAYALENAGSENAVVRKKELDVVISDINNKGFINTADVNNLVDNAINKAVLNDDKTQKYALKSHTHDEYTTSDDVNTLIGVLENKFGDISNIVYDGINDEDRVMRKKDLSDIITDKVDDILSTDTTLVKQTHLDNYALKDHTHSSYTTKDDVNTLISEDTTLVKQAQLKEYAKTTHNHDTAYIKSNLLKKASGETTKYEVPTVSYVNSLLKNNDDNKDDKTFTARLPVTFLLVGEEKKTICIGIRYNFTSKNEPEYIFLRIRDAEKMLRERGFFKGSNPNNVFFMNNLEQGGKSTVRGAILENFLKLKTDFMSDFGYTNTFLVGEVDEETKSASFIYDHIQYRICNKLMDFNVVASEDEGTIVIRSLFNTAIFVCSDDVILNCPSDHPYWFFLYISDQLCKCKHIIIDLNPLDEKMKHLNTIYFFGVKDLGEVCSHDISSSNTIIETITLRNFNFRSSWKDYSDCFNVDYVQNFYPNDKESGGKGDEYCSVLSNDKSFMLTNFLNLTFFDISESFIDEILTKTRHYFTKLPKIKFLNLSTLKIYQPVDLTYFFDDMDADNRNSCSLETVDLSGIILDSNVDAFDIGDIFDLGRCASVKTLYMEVNSFEILKNKGASDAGDWIKEEETFRNGVLVGKYVKKV